MSCVCIYIYIEIVVHAYILHCTNQNHHTTHERCRSACSQGYSHLISINNLDSFYNYLIFYLVFPSFIRIFFLLRVYVHYKIIVRFSRKNNFSQFNARLSIFINLIFIINCFLFLIKIPNGNFMFQLEQSNFSAIIMKNDTRVLSFRILYYSTCTPIKRYSTYILVYSCCCTPITNLSSARIA